MNKLLGILAVLALFGVAQTAKADICIGPGGINLGGRCGHNPPPPPYTPPPPPSYYPPAPPPPPVGEACFYNQNGNAFCKYQGESVSDLGNPNTGWNDQIVSVVITGNATAYVCLNGNFVGPCEYINQSQQLPPGWAYAISSISVQ